MESIIPEQELSMRVTVSSRSNLGAPRVRCNSNHISQKRGSRLQMRLSLDGNQKGFKRLWGCRFMIAIWSSVYIHPDGKSIIPEQELSKRVTVSSRSNLGAPRVRCNSNSISQKRGSRLQMRLSLDGNQKGFERL
jgi:hypothetical protein